jgi:P-type conjugative transfer protein TrbJ
MLQHKKSILILIATALVVPAACWADIVFDPSNYAQAVLQVGNDVQMVAKLQQEIQNQLAMLKGWGYTQLPGILASMGIWQQVFGQEGSTYTSTSPGGTLNTLYPSDPSSYSQTNDSAIAQMRQEWDQTQRQTLIENRTVQNDTYLDLSPTAQRIQAYIQQSNSAPGITAATQAGNEELATVIAQVQAMEAQEITDGRAEVQKEAQEQADEAYGQEQRQAARGQWDNPAPPSSSVVNSFSSAQ